MTGSCVNFSFSGWGVFAKNGISKGSFLLEYRARYNLMKDMKVQLEHYKKKGLVLFTNMRSTMSNIGMYLVYQILAAMTFSSSLCF